MTNVLNISVLNLIKPTVFHSGTNQTSLETQRMTMKTVNNREELQKMAQDREMHVITTEDTYPADVYKREGYLVAVPSGSPKPPKGSVPLEGGPMVDVHLQVARESLLEVVREFGGMMPACVIAWFEAGCPKQVSGEEFLILAEVIKNVVISGIQRFSGKVTSEKVWLGLRNKALAKGQTEINYMGVKVSLETLLDVPVGCVACTEPELHIIDTPVAN